MTSNLSINASTQALMRNQHTVNKLSANIAHYSSDDRVTKVNELIDITNANTEAKVLQKTINTQNICIDSLLDIYA